MSPLTKTWLLRYVMVLATLAFVGRAVPFAFLALALENDFHQSQVVVGVVMALYPLAALLATPVAARIARSTKRIVSLHSGSLLMIAGALALSAAAPAVQHWMGDVAGVLWLGFCRVCQGVGVSFYLSSNTSLLARKFPGQLTYAIAMTEVFVGMGGQIGRIAGGFLFDLGGMPLPFLACAGLQASIALVGFAFEEDGSVQPTVKRQISDPMERSTVSWSLLVTPRLLVAALATLWLTLIGGFIDATILPFLAVHLAPISVGEMALTSSFRAMAYLLTSFLLAPLMRNEALSCEILIAAGGALTVIGLLFQAPAPFVLSLVSWLSGSEPSWGCLLGLLLASFSMASGGAALLFVPALPLMQHEVRKFGPVAVEQVAELFVMMMTLGEMVGPVVGGWLVQEFSFTFACLLLSCASIPLFVLSVATYDSAAIRARRIERPVESLDDQERQAVTTTATSLPCEGCGPQCAVPMDGEGNFAVRRLLFAIDVKNNDSFVDLPSSAPPEAFRRSFVGPLASPLLLGTRGRGVPQSAPSQAFRKTYEPPTGGLPRRPSLKGLPKNSLDKIMSPSGSGKLGKLPGGARQPAADVAQGA